MTQTITAAEKRKKIVIIDNGTQYGQLYAKRFRDLGVDVDSIDAGVYYEGEKLVRPKVSLFDILGYAGVVVAGGKSSVTDDESKRVDIDPRIYSQFDGPVLGTCFGHQDMADRMGGKVISGLKQCGPVFSAVNPKNPLFYNLEFEVQRLNSTHNDGVSEMPEGFKRIAYSINDITGLEHIDAMCKNPDSGKNNWRIGTQFHPETSLTENGETMLSNFISLCGLKTNKIQKEEKIKPNIDAIVAEQYTKIKEVTKDKQIFLPISGGIDSTVATAMLLHAGISRDSIHAFHIDTGFNRLNESEEVVTAYHQMGWDFVTLLDKKDFFANFSLSEEDLRKDLQGKGFSKVALKDAVYSEHKRFLFQTAYAIVIEEYQKALGLDFSNSVLVQGTNQADKVESGKGGKKHSGSAHIKSHHNVGAFNNKYKDAGNFLEPVDRFFKPDIYELGSRYNLSEFFSSRKPFPGPGLLLRIGNHNMIESGMYSQQSIDGLCAVANQFSNMHSTSAYITPIEAVGTCGDERAVGVMAILQAKQNHEENLVNNLDNLLYIAGQIPHYTTFSRQECITRCLVPLYAFDSNKTNEFTEAKLEGRAVEELKIFDDEVNKIVDSLGIKMTQTVNYMITDNLGEQGKYTFVFRPWQAPDLMTGIPLIPEDKTVRKELIDRLKSLKDKHDFIGNICIDLTYKPIGGTEIM